MAAMNPAPVFDWLDHFMALAGDGGMRDIGKLRRLAPHEVWLVGIMRADYAEAQYCMINVRLADGSLVACDGTDLELRTALNCALQHIHHEMSRSIERMPAGRLGGTDPDIGWRADTTPDERHPNAA